MEYEGIASVMIPAFLSMIWKVTFFASVFRITRTVFNCDVTNPMNSSDVCDEDVTPILRDPGGTNLLK